MKRSEPPKSFELENLEQRILLSGDPLIGAAQGIAPDELDPFDSGPEPIPVEEVLIPGDDTSQETTYPQSLQYDPSQELTDIFSGLSEEDPFSDQQGDAALEEGTDLTGTDSGDTNLDPALQTDQSSDHSITSNHQIGEAEKEALIQGLEELANLGSLLEDFDAFSIPLLLTKDASFGRLLGLYEILDDRLSTPVYDYFSDATDPPTTEGLLAAMQEVPDTPDLKVHVDVLSGGYNTTSDELRFVFEYAGTREGEVRLDAGAQGEAFGFSFAEDALVEYVAGITLDIAFGVELEGGAAEFFLELHQLAADLDMSTSVLNGWAHFETTPAPLRVVNGTLDLDVHVSVRFDESIAGDGRITLSELRDITSENIENFIILIPAGTLLAELPLETVDNPTFLYIKSDDLFGGVKPEISVRTDISTLKDPILELLKGLSEAGENITGFDRVNTTFPVIDTSINDLLSQDPDLGLGDYVDFYTPSLEYFTLLDAFNFDINEHSAAIGALPGIEISEFDLDVAEHRLKLKNLLEKEYSLSLSPDWELSLYLPEIWSLFNPDFEINDYLPTFQLLLGLPYIPKMDEVRSDIKS